MRWLALIDQITEKLGIIHTSVWIAPNLWSDINQTYTTFYSAIYLLRKWFIQSRELTEVYVNSLNADQFSFVGRQNFRPFLYEIVLVNFYVMGVLHKWLQITPHHFTESEDIRLYCIWVFHCIWKEFSCKVHIEKNVFSWPPENMHFSFLTMDLKIKNILMYNTVH